MDDFGKCVGSLEGGPVWVFGRMTRMSIAWAWSWGSHVTLLNLKAGVIGWELGQLILRDFTLNTCSSVQIFCPASHTFKRSRDLTKDMLHKHKVLQDIEWPIWWPWILSLWSAIVEILERGDEFMLTASEGGHNGVGLAINWEQDHPNMATFKWALTKPSKSIRRNGFKKTDLCCFQLVNSR